MMTKPRFPEAAVAELGAKKGYQIYLLLHVIPCFESVICCCFFLVFRDATSMLGISPELVKNQYHQASNHGLVQRLLLKGFIFQG